MLYDPMADYKMDVQKRDLLHEDLFDELSRSQIMGFATWGNAQPFAAAVAVGEVFRYLKIDSLIRSFKALIVQLTVSDPDPTEVRSTYENNLGVYLPVSDETFNEMMNEVKRYKWLEAEKAGRDIWKERHPKDPDVGALREWFQNHFGAWYLSRQKAIRG